MKSEEEVAKMEEEERETYLQHLDLYAQYGQEFELEKKLEEFKTLPEEEVNKMGEEEREEYLQL